MTKSPTDRDGKSKTASAVGAEHYPEQHEVDDGGLFPSMEQIARRAHELWIKRGCPEGSAEQDWLQAEQELKARNPFEASSPALRQSSAPFSVDLSMKNGPAPTDRQRSRASKC